jgi:hypothetical protein
MAGSGILCGGEVVVIRGLAGSRHFNDLRRGVPLMSPTLLAPPEQLEAAGVLARSRTGVAAVAG